MEGLQGLSLFRSILTVLAVLLLAYYCSRFLGKRGTRFSAQRNMKVIEQLPAGQGRILLLKVGEHVYLVGVSHAGIQLLTELEKDIQLDETLPFGEGSRGEKSPLQKNLEKCAGNALDWTGEFLKKKAGRLKTASQQGTAPYEVLPGGLPPKGQPFQEILQSRAAAVQDMASIPAVPEHVPDPAAAVPEHVPDLAVPERAGSLATGERAGSQAALESTGSPAAPKSAPIAADQGDTGPRPIEGGEKDG